jgi:serine/threonine protein kinase
LIKERDRVDQRFEETEIWAFLRQLLMALAYLHGLGILHRDVKPSNVFVDLEGALQLGDLGSAKVGERENYTRVGTPLYLAPEIIKYEAYSEKVDIWSLGVTLYQLAALRPPFQHPNFLKLAQSITYEEPQYPLYFSRRLKACIAEMLRKDPKERPSA